jgi:hypothetical protein
LPQKEEIVAKFLDAARLEVERVVGDQDGRIGAAYDFDGAANVGERATAGADVVVSFVGLEVFILVVVHDVAAGDDFVGLVIVFDVVGLQALVAIVNIDSAIGEGEVALLFLGTGGGKLSNAALSGRRFNLLGRRGTRAKGDAQKHEPNREQRRQRKYGARRGVISGTGVAIHAEHSIV